MSIGQQNARQRHGARSIPLAALARRYLWLTLTVVGGVFLALIPLGCSQLTKPNTLTLAQQTLRAQSDATDAAVLVIADNTATAEAHIKEAQSQATQTASAVTFIEGANTATAEAYLTRTQVQATQTAEVTATAKAATKATAEAHLQGEQAKATQTANAMATTEAENSPLPRYSVFSGDMINIDTGAKEGLAVVASIPGSETKDFIIISYVIGTPGCPCQLSNSEFILDKIDGETFHALGDHTAMEATLSEDGTILTGKIMYFRQDGRINRQQNFQVKYSGTGKEAIVAEVTKMRDEMLTGKGVTIDELLPTDFSNWPSQ